MPTNVDKQINITLEVITVLRKAIEVEPTNVNAWLSLAFALKDTQQIDEAIIAYSKAIELNSEAYFIYKELADIYYLIKNEPETTLEYYKKYLEYDQKNSDAKGCLGLSYLKTKNYKEGWKYFEYRPHKERSFSARASASNDFIKTKPIWQGEDIKDKTIYVYYEAGYGDTMMFARYLPLLKNKCARIIFKPEGNCTGLFKNSIPGIEILSKNDSEYDLKYDVHAPIMSLPYLLKLNLEKDIPFANGYLKSDVEKFKNYKRKYFNNNLFKIGINWQGSTTFDSSRKIKLESFYKLFELPNIKFYSLQKDYGIEQLKDASKYDIVDLGATFKDFSDTAAAIENLDLVISNDTSVAHLAGALNKQCWILLPFVQDWRWSTDLSYCPWYKSVKLFKQNTAGNWNEVIDKVYKELANLCRKD